MTNNQLAAAFSTCAIVAVAFGFLLGTWSQPEALSPANSEQSESVNQLAEQQAQILTALNLLTLSVEQIQSAGLATPIQQRQEVPASELHASGQTASGSGTDLASLLQRLESTVEQLEYSASSSELTVGQSTARTLRDASDPRRSRNDHEILRTLDELRSLEHLDEDERNTWRMQNLISMQEGLSRFGKPDKIFFEGDQIEWWYEDTRQHADGDTEVLWSMYLQFRDGLLVDFDGDQSDG